MTTFTDSRLIHRPETNPLLSRLRERYDLPLGNFTGLSASVNLKFEMPDGHHVLWERAAKLSGRRLRRHLLRCVSLTLQDVLRCWIPYLWLSHPTNWDEPNLLWPMLIYATSRTYKPVSRENYSFDLLCENTVPSLLRSCLPTMREWQPLLQELMADHPVPRRELRVFRMLDVVERSDFHPQPLKRLLAHEHQVLSAFLDFADGTNRGSNRVDMQLHHHLNRFYSRVDFNFLSPLLRMEAENALATAFSGRTLLTQSISLAVPAPGTQPAPLPRPGRFVDQTAATKFAAIRPS